MKKLFTTFLICTALGSLTAQEMTVDGLSSDWSKDLLTLDKKTNLTTAVRNDAENLYILFQTDNPTSITKMLQAGMEITFKAKTKPKVNAKMEFPLEAARGEAARGEAAQRGGQRQRGQGQGGQGTDRAAQLKARIEAQLETKNQAKLKGFSVSNGQLLLADLKGIQTGLGFDDNSDATVLNYELKIPLVELYGASMNWDKITSTDLDISIKINGIDAPQGTGGSVGAGAGGGRGGAGAGGGRGGAGGGRGGAGGGRGGAGAGTSSQGGTGMFTDQVVKLSYRIAK